MNTTPQAEGLYQQFSSNVVRIKDKYGHNLTVEREKVANTARGILKKAERGYYKLHMDFRGNATDALENLKGRIQSVLGRYRVSDDF